MNQRHIIGLDLGQAQEYTALAVAEHTWQKGGVRDAASFAFRHLQRWPLGTAFPQIVADVGRMLEQVPGAELVVDATACGRAILDLFRYAGWPVPVIPVTITAGSEVLPGEHGGYHVPKRDLVSGVQAGLQTKRITFAASLRETATLTRELQAFRTRVVVGKSLESFEDWRQRDHDDLVLAVALAIWYGERGCGPWEPTELSDDNKCLMHPDNIPEGVFLTDHRPW